MLQLILVLRTRTLCSPATERSEPVQSNYELPTQVGGVRVLVLRTFVYRKKCSCYCLVDNHLTLPKFCNLAEIFEFNATDDPPTRMDVEVFDYDGPFSAAESLGHAEINFLRQSPGDLSDIWLSLNGKSARANGSKLHLRVYLTNTRDADALPEYLERVEREVGLKVFGYP